MPTELGLRQTESEGGEGAVTKEQVSNFWCHRAAAAQSRRSPSACLASTTIGEATEAMTKSPIVVVTVVAQAFIVGLLGVDNKRWGNRGNRATSQGGSSKDSLSLSRWQGGNSGGAGPVCCWPASR